MKPGGRKGCAQHPCYQNDSLWSGGVQSVGRLYREGQGSAMASKSYAGGEEREGHNRGENTREKSVFSPTSAPSHAADRGCCPYGRGRVRPFLPISFSACHRYFSPSQSCCWPGGPTYPESRIKWGRRRGPGRARPRWEACAEKRSQVAASLTAELFV